MATTRKETTRRESAMPPEGALGASHASASAVTRGGMGTKGTIAVALHDVEPAPCERCARIRDWLDDHGVDRVTLLVIPARDLHPLGERSPEMIQWLPRRPRPRGPVRLNQPHH